MASFKAIPEKKLPSKGTPGDGYYTTDGHCFYIAVADGTLLNLADVLSGAAASVRVVGPQGERGLPGPKGDAVVGPPGKDGRDGARGETGAAGKTPSRQEIAEIIRSLSAELRGEKGEAGPPGRDGIVRVDLSAAAESRIAALESTVDALVQKDQKSREYIEWLKTRVQARAAKG